MLGLPFVQAARVHAHGVTLVEQRKGQWGWGLGQPKGRRKGKGQGKVRSGNVTALGFDNGKNLTPSSLGLINQGDVAACCGVGWRLVPLVGLPCAAVAVAGMSLHLGPAFFANQGPSSGVVLHHPVKS